VRRIFFSLVVAVTALCASPAGQGSPSERLVAIADIHGGFEPFVSILTAAKLIDAQRHWIGGKAVLVQTGDITDRGTGVREALDLLMSLEKEAGAAGGKVNVTLGNHEVMNMFGELRDVAPEVLTAFGGEAAYIAAFSRDGRYGKWLRGKPVVTTINGTAFMHAGINLEFSDVSLDDLNKRARREIEAWDDGRRQLEESKLVDSSARFAQVVDAARAELERLKALLDAKKPVPEDTPRVAALLLPVANIVTSSLFNGDGPLWFRGFAGWTDEEGAAKMAALLKHFSVSRFVTGHNPQRNGQILERFGGALFLIDTGMLDGKFFPGGKPSALEISGGVAKPIYVN
jgi:hypothetical protein